MNTRRLVTVFAALSLVLMTCCAALAAPIFEDNFDGTAGDDITSLGWTPYGYTGVIKVTDAVIDSGNAAKVDGTTAAMYRKNLPDDTVYILGEDEVVSLIWTSNTPANSNTLAGFRDATVAKYWQAYNWGGTFYWYAGDPGGPSGSMAVPEDVKYGILDMRIDMSRTGSAFYYRQHGTGDWRLMAESTAGSDSIQYVRMFQQYYDANYIPSIDSIKIETAKSSITGKVTLEDYDGDVTKVGAIAQLIQDGSPVGTAVKLDLDAAGNYAIGDVIPGTYSIAFDSICWLRQVVDNVVVTLATPGSADVTLVGGDVDGDEQVTTSDLSAVLKNLDKVGQ